MLIKEKKLQYFYHLIFMENNDKQIIQEILRKNNLSVSENITRFTSGQINRVYNINGKYVLKIEGDIEIKKGLFKHQPEITERLLYAGVKVPKIIDYGKVDGKEYLLMEKVKGTNLSYEWLKFDDSQRENFLIQLADQLQKIHSIKFGDYALPMCRKKRFSNFNDAIRNSIQFEKIDKTKLSNNLRESIEYLDKFYEKNISLINNNEESVLIHNDIHFENIFFAGDKITGIIDWDWACQAPRDYELWKIVDYFYEPADYVEEGLESVYSQYVPKNEIKILRENYPKLFEASDLCEKIRLYLLENIIGLVSDTQAGIWSNNVLDKVERKIEVIYKNDWLEKFLLR
ncbi:MAG: aminoglycoside phosphotransferase family protein [Patescibacteria group bacterium]